MRQKLYTYILFLISFDVLIFSFLQKRRKKLPINSIIIIIIEESIVINVKISGGNKEEIMTVL